MSRWDKSPEGRAYAARWRAENKEKIAADNKAYREANKEKIAANNKKWRTANKERLATKQREYYAANKKRLDAQTAAWYQKNKERILAEMRTPEARAHQRKLSRARRQGNPEKYAAEARAFREANKEYFAKKLKAWQKDNPEKLSTYQARRYAKVKGAEGSHTLAEWQEICELYGHRCAYCGAAKKLTRDHVIPISGGGSDYISNIVPACKSCNSTKRARPPGDFVPAEAAP